MAVDPFDGILIEDAQVSCLIILDKRGDDTSLLLILRHIPRFLQPIDDLCDGLRVHAAFTPYQLLKSICRTDQFAVQTPRWWLWVVGILFLGIIVLYLMLCDAFIEIAGGSEHQVFSISFVHSFWPHLRVKDDGEEFIHHFRYRLPWKERQQSAVDVGYKRAEILG